MTSTSGKEDGWAKNSLSSQLLCLTYGCTVEQLTKDYGDPEVVSQILHRMGKNMGKRMADEIISKTKIQPSTTYIEHMEACEKVRKFLKNKN